MTVEGGGEPRGKRRGHPVEDLTPAEACARYRAAGWPVDLSDRGEVTLRLGDGWCALVTADRAAEEHRDELARAHGLIPRAPALKGYDVLQLAIFRCGSPTLLTSPDLGGAVPGLSVWGAGQVVALPPSQARMGAQVRWGAGLAEDLRVRDVPRLPGWLEAMARDPLEAAKGVRRTEDLANLGTTDTDNATRFVRRHGADVRYCHAWKSWLTWRGKRWETDARGETTERAKDTARSIHDEAKDRPGAKLGAWADKSLSAAGLASMLKLAQSAGGVPVEPQQFDADPWAVNCLNGVVDIRTGELRPHRREDLCTKMLPVRYDPEARSERWEKFLLESQGGDAEMVAFLARAVGYSLTGDVREEKLFFVHGPPAAGKSTFLEAIKATFGDYAKTANFETFLAKQSQGGANDDIARLMGARFVASIEVDEGKRLAEGLVKALTGGDVITARFLYQAWFEFRPTFKLWLAANHEPKVKDDDAAMWRRILRLCFNVSIPRERRDPKLKLELVDPEVSGPAILAWAVRGAQDWMRGGLRVPARIDAATEEYRQKMDPLGEFFAARCVFDPEAVEARATLRHAYETWVKENGSGHPISPKSFTERLRRRIAEDLGPTFKPETSKRVPKCRCEPCLHTTLCPSMPVDAWRGVRLLASEPAAPPAAEEPSDLIDHSPWDMP